MAKLITKKYKQAHDGVCYIIEAKSGSETFYKVGHSRHGHGTRLSKIQTSCPIKLEVVSVVDGNEAMERSMHETFKETRLHNEWFADNELIRDFIKANPLTKWEEQLSEAIAGIFR